MPHRMGMEIKLVQKDHSCPKGACSLCWELRSAGEQYQYLEGPRCFSFKPQSLETTQRKE
jgi:hypothetical protein